jgi:hypothetical protein
MSLSESHIPSIASNDSMHSLSQLGTIREELDGELALGAETDLPHCPQHDLEWCLSKAGQRRSHGKAEIIENHGWICSIWGYKLQSIEF